VWHGFSSSTARHSRIPSILRVNIGLSGRGGGLSLDSICKMEVSRLILVLPLKLLFLNSLLVGVRWMREVDVR